MTPLKQIYNELADEAARQGQITRTDPSCISLLKDDSQAKHELHMIANRIATIEASIWNKDDTFKKFEGSKFDKLENQMAQQIKGKRLLHSTTRQGEKAITSTSIGCGVGAETAQAWLTSRTNPTGRISHATSS